MGKDLVHIVSDHVIHNADLFFAKRLPSHSSQHRRSIYPDEIDHRYESQELDTRFACIRWSFG